MSKGRWRKYFQSLARVERYRLLRPFHHRAGDHKLWALDRHSVARGVAIGFFFGILTPVAQIVFAIVAAMALRANLAVAAGSTLISNPFTFPPIYYFAYRIGSFLTGRGASAAVDVAVSEQAAKEALDVSDWVPTLVSWVSSIGPPLVVGVVTLALSAALLGYVLVYAVWGWLTKAGR